jgi:hypothetical protein
MEGVICCSFMGTGMICAEKGIRIVLFMVEIKRIVELRNQLYVTRWWIHHHWLKI